MSKLSPEQVAQLQGEIETAKQNMQDRHALWMSILDEYCMRNYDTLVNTFAPMASFAQSDFMASNSRVPYINLYVRKMLGMVATRNNEYLLDPRRPDQEVIASVLEFALECVIDKIGMEDKMTEACLWGLMLGTAIVKVGYASELVYGQESWADKKPVGADSLPDSETDSPYRMTTERGAALSNGNPALRIIPTFDYYKDAGARNDGELRREYVRYRRLLMDAKMDSRYTRAGREALQGFKLTDDFYGTNWCNDSNVATDDTLYCYVWEVVDLPSGMWCVVGEAGEEPLIDWTPLALPKGMSTPFVKLRLIPNVSNFWGISYAALMMPSAVSMNVVKAQTINQISRDGKKVMLYDEQAVHDADVFRSNMASAKHMDTVPMGGMMEGKKPYDIIDFGGVNPELVRLQGMYSNDLATISQLTDQARNSASNESTATEVNVRNSQQQIMTGDLRSAFYSFHTEIARAICRTMLVEWPQSKMIKIMGADPRVYFWFDLEKDKVADEFDIKIVMGTSEDSNRVVVRRQLTELAPVLMQIGDRIQMQQQAAAQNPQMAGSFNWEGFAELLLDQYDPKFKNKILRKKDPFQMVIDLVQTKGIQNIQMSPMLKKQVGAYLSMADSGLMNAEMGDSATPQNNGTLNNNGGMNLKPNGAELGGMPMTDSPAFQSGRAASESMGTN